MTEWHHSRQPRHITREGSANSLRQGSLTSPPTEVTTTLPAHDLLSCSYYGGSSQGNIGTLFEREAL
jgi:hypothetical protein